MLRFIEFKNELQLLFRQIHKFLHIQMVNLYLINSYNYKKLNVSANDIQVLIIYHIIFSEMYLHYRVCFLSFHPSCNLNVMLLLLLLYCNINKGRHLGSWLIDSILLFWWFNLKLFIIKNISADLPSNLQSGSNLMAIEFDCFS